ncbi:thiamin pyrophosphokinase [Trichococcus palustris]|uniref:Thiamine diphosphokinase n=1 Tax=Trichococcus palustris TaxID=140314 RepID=A0A143Y8B4_9LACT|nr:thiamine diphosphokinase [Trichococcus palustris]CZQ82739.1 thiamin pyrophosphokinase [Trichococcus palustris]SFK68063.1 thiamine pyrophosphokinase [Trichococcus palustris]
MPSQKVVIVVGGDQTGVAGLLGTYTEGYRFIGADRGALTLAEVLPQFDAAIGDFDSVSAAELERVKEKSARFMVLPAQKDETDTEAALAYAITAYQPEEIILLGALGGRLDHLMSNLWLCYHPRFKDSVAKIVVQDEQNTLRFFQPGNHQLTKDADKKYLSFVSMTPVKKLILCDVAYPLDARDYDHPVALVSNEFKQDKMTFSFEKGLLAVIQSKDKKK